MDKQFIEALFNITSLPIDMWHYKHYTLLPLIFIRHQVIFADNEPSKQMI